MRVFHKQNGVKLTCTYKNGLTDAQLTSEDRHVDICRSDSDGTWVISLYKRVKEIDGSSVYVPLRTYLGKTHSEAIAYFDKKQYELGFFNN
jgi:hypothetical protein